MPPLVLITRESLEMRNSTLKAARVTENLMYKGWNIFQMIPGAFCKKESFRGVSPHLGSTRIQCAILYPARIKSKFAGKKQFQIAQMWQLLLQAKNSQTSEITDLWASQEGTE